MKNFLKFMAIVLTIGFFAACSKDGEQAELVTITESHADLINQELAQYSNIEGIENARKVLIAFDKTLAEANTVTYDYEAGELFAKNAANTGLEVYNDFETYQARYANKSVPEVPSELLEIIAKFADLVKANSVDEYLGKVQNLIDEAKSSDLELKEKGAILISLVILKVIGKIVKAVPQKADSPSKDDKWKSYLKCAIQSVASGFAGGLPACSKGSKVVGGIGMLFGGGQGKAIGSLVGCTVGAVIAGIKDLTITAIQCSKDEGLTEK